MNLGKLEKASFQRIGNNEVLSNESLPLDLPSIDA